MTGDEPLRLAFWCLLLAAFVGSALVWGSDCAPAHSTPGPTGLTFGAMTAMDRRYRILTVVLDEAVSFEEAQATMRAIRMIRGVQEARLLDIPMVSMPGRDLYREVDPALFEP